MEKEKSGESQSCTRAVLAAKAGRTETSDSGRFRENGNQIMTGKDNRGQAFSWTQADYNRMEIISNGKEKTSNI